MSTFWRGFIIGILVAGVVSFTVWPRSRSSQTTEKNRQKAKATSYFSVDEWAVRVPANIFADRSAEGYLMGSIDSPVTGEVLVFLDAPLSSIAADLGSEVVEQAKSCLPYYPGILRTAKGASPGEGVPPVEKRLANFDYRPMTSQSTCNTDPADTSMSEFDSHVISAPSSATIIKALVTK